MLGNGRMGPAVRRAAGAVLALVLIALALGAPVARAATPAVFDVGASVVKINPSYPVYMGGYGGGPDGGTIARHVNPLTGRPEDFTVRAIAIRSGGNVVELATVDTQGYFAGYQEGPYGITDVRDEVGAFLRAHGVPSASRANVIVSSLHVHAGPTLLGIWGPADHQLPYLKQVASAVTQALERAYEQARPATITWGRADAPWVADLTIAQGNSFEGWPRDGSLGALWARDARTGATIATYVTQPGYPNIVYGPGDLLRSDGTMGAVLSSDFPPYLEDYVQRRLGGIAVVTDGTLGNQTGPMQTDVAPSPDLPPEDGMRQTRAFDDTIHMGELIGNLTLGALAHGHPLTSATAQPADQYVQSPATNPVLVADAEVAPIQGGSFWRDAGADNVVYPTDRAYTPPYGDAVAFGTWVTSFRIGNLMFITMPGEFFPSIHDVWNRSIHGPDAVFVVGAAQDFLGYEYPAYAYPFTFEGSDEGFFNPSITLGDQVVTAGQQEAQALGFNADLTSNAELTALENNYARAVSPGVQLIPFPPTGDLDPRTHAFAPTLEGYSQAPRVSSSAPCGPINPSTASGCPVAPAQMGPFHWRFGDGTTSTTPPEAYARANFSPFLHHPYCRPGTYQVQVSATDAEQGKTDSMTLPVTVYPALSVSIARRGRSDVASVHGGSGQVLLYRWTLPGGRTAYGPSIPAPAHAPVPTLTVVDGTGTTAVAPSPRRRASQPTATGACASRAPARPRRTRRRRAAQRRHGSRRHATHRARRRTRVRPTFTG